jgi:hypothetical protein
MQFRFLEKLSPESFVNFELGRPEDGQIDGEIVINLGVEVVANPVQNKNHRRVDIYPREYRFSRMTVFESHKIYPTSIFLECIDGTI